MDFKSFLTEAADKNVHLEHLEDEVLNGGVNGTRSAINFLQALRDMLAGHATSKINVTTKWDGAPAIFAGINPENGQFFVGTKSVFNKDAKLNYTNADIDKNHPAEGLNRKLKYALRYLPKLGIQGILQGDMMFTKGDIEVKEIDGEEYAIFQPNTIVYAVPTDTKLARMMMDAQIGVVFHTSYTGKSMADMKASFNIDIRNLKPTKDVWFRDASFVDASGTATFTQEETTQITALLASIGRQFREINSLVMNRVATNETIKVQIKTFNNTKVRQGEAIRDTAKHTRELIVWVEDKLNKEVLSAKKAETKKKRIAEKNEIMRFYRMNAGELTKMFNLQNDIVQAKNMVIKKLQQIRQVTGTFVRTDDGYKVTNPEGFVAVDRLKGNAVKLVDRLEFSHQNFNVSKNWTK